MTPEEREAKEQEEFQTGPLRVLTDSVKNNTQVLINCRFVYGKENKKRPVKYQTIQTFIGITRSCWGG